MIIIESLVDIYVLVFQLKIIELYYVFFVLIQWMIVKISMTSSPGSHWLSVLYNSFLVFNGCCTEGESFKIKRWRDVNVTSTLVNVCKTLTNVDASRRPPYLTKTARRWRLKAYLSKAETLTWRQRFQKHTLGILLGREREWSSGGGGAPVAAISWTGSRPSLPGFTAYPHTDARPKDWPKKNFTILQKKHQNKHLYI